MLMSLLLGLLGGLAAAGAASGSSDDGGRGLLDRDELCRLAGGAVGQVGADHAVDRHLHLAAEAGWLQGVEPGVHLTLDVDHQADDPLAGQAEVLDVSHVGRTAVDIVRVLVPLQA